MKKIRRLLLGTLLSLFGFTSMSLAQDATTIVGTVLYSAKCPIIDWKGEPVAGVQITAIDSSGNIVDQVITDEDGRYALENLPSGVYDLTLDPRQTGFLGETVVASLNREGLTVNWGVSTACKAIALAAPGTRDIVVGFGDIVGTVVHSVECPNIDWQGKPVSGVQITAIDSFGNIVEQVITDEDGQYAFENLPSGVYDLTLDPLQSGFLGETVVASLNREGLTVNWGVSTACKAIALAAPGTDILAGWFLLGAAVPAAVPPIVAILLTPSQ